jgi:ABC-type lipoprotein release transport system permease subunit
MGIPFVAGRDLQVTDAGPDEATGTPGAAIVNERFVESYFQDEPVVGRVFEKVEANGRMARYQIVGIVGNTRYRSLRDPMPPAAYVPLTPAGLARPIDRATFIVQTLAADPLTLAPALRQEVTQAASALRVSAIRTQQAIDESHTVRERLLASIALFFAGVALTLAGVGLYGVLDYSVLQRSREIGIRMALGARPADVVWRVTVQAWLMVFLGGLVGVSAGLASVRSIESLLYGVRATDPLMVALPCVVILTVALVAATRPVLRAVRIDPVKMLRAD